MEESPLWLNIMESTQSTHAWELVWVMWIDISSEKEGGCKWQNNGKLVMWQRAGLCSAHEKWDGLCFLSVIGRVLGGSGYGFLNSELDLTQNLGTSCNHFLKAKHVEV